MKRRISLFLAIAFMLCIALPIFANAADPSSYSDIQGHWAESHIKEAISSNLMTSDNSKTFHPDRLISRAEFVTVLGRFAGINPDAWRMNYPTKNGSLFSDVEPSKYYAPYVNWAVRIGVSNGIGINKFAPSEPITREQMLTMIARFAKVTGKVFSTSTNVTQFTDESAFSSYAKEPLEKLRNTGIICGISNGDGTYRFAPKHYTTRAHVAVILQRMAKSISDDPNWNETFVTLVMLNESAKSLEVAAKIALRPQIFPSTASNSTITWLSTDPSIATVSATGEVKALNKGTCTIYAYSSNGCKASCVISCTKAPSHNVEDTFDDIDSYYDFSEDFYSEDVPIDWSAANDYYYEDNSDLSLENTLAYSDETYEDKSLRLFGTVVDDPRTAYTSEEEARENIVSVVVPAWDINENGEKYTRWFTLEVHTELANTVMQIFNEIYACPAQYPIHDAGGFRFVSWSEHNFGAAIDINPEENFYCDPEGNAVVGYFFQPDISEYSIPVGGEIDQIFAKYGFTRGIYWKSGYRDFMHYSYFGT